MSSLRLSWVLGLLLLVVLVNVEPYDVRHACEAPDNETSDELVMRVCSQGVGTVGGEEALAEDE